MILTTTGCKDCPFHSHYYNNWDMDIDTCDLMYHLDWHSSYLIDFYKNGKVRSKNKKTLDNCPLLAGKLELSLTNF